RRAVRPAALRAPGYRRGAWRFRRHAGVEQDDRRRQDDDRAALRAGAGRPRARLRVPRGRRRRVRRPPASRGRARRRDGATGADVTVPEVAMRWWQDYLSVAQAVASLILGVTGLFVIFNGPIVK